MIIGNNFVWLILTQIILVDKTISKKFKIVVPKMEMKCNPAIINNTLLSFTYQTFNEGKYIKTVEPMTSNLHYDLKSVFVSKSFVQFT